MQAITFESLILSLDWCSHVDRVGGSLLSTERRLEKILCFLSVGAHAHSQIDDYGSSRTDGQILADLAQSHRP